jgi:hypothetical protein
MAAIGLPVVAKASHVGMCPIPQSWKRGSGTNRQRQSELAFRQFIPNHDQNAFQLLQVSRFGCELNRPELQRALNLICPVPITAVVKTCSAVAQKNFHPPFTNAAEDNRRNGVFPDPNGRAPAGQPKSIDFTLLL